MCTLCSATFYPGAFPGREPMAAWPEPDPFGWPSAGISGSDFYGFWRPNGTLGSTNCLEAKNNVHPASTFQKPNRLLLGTIAPFRPFHLGLCQVSIGYVVVWLRHRSSAFRTSVYKDLRSRFPLRHRTSRQHTQLHRGGLHGPILAKPRYYRQSWTMSFLTTPFWPCLSRSGRQFPIWFATCFPFLFPHSEVSWQAF